MPVNANAAPSRVASNKRKDNEMTYGIKEQIQNADSVSVIEKLLKIGATLEDAPLATRRRWERVAKQRRDELNKRKG